MSDMKTRRILGYPDEFWIFFLCVISFFLRIIFDIQHGYAYQDYNLGEWLPMTDDSVHTGSLGVIHYIFEHHALPNFSPLNLPGYECPPLFYIFCSIMLELLHRLLGNPIGTSLHTILLFNVVFVTIGTHAGISVLRRFGLRGRPRLIATLLLTFYPGFYIMGAVFTADAMCFMFTMLTLDRVMSWYLFRKKNKLVLCGLYFGLAMMTSYAAASVLIPVVTLVVFALCEKRTENRIIMDHVRWAVIFGGLLGLWWPVYNFIRFGLPLFYVHLELPEWHLIGSDVSMWNRLRPPLPADFTNLHVFQGASGVTNVWAQLFKTALFSENVIDMSLRGTAVCCGLMTGISILLCILFHAMWVRVLQSRYVYEGFKIFSVIGYISLLAAYSIFCMVHPMIGAMNFRFIPICLFYPMIGITLAVERETEGKKGVRILMKISACLIFVFSVLSAVIFGFYA